MTKAPNCVRGPWSAAASGIAASGSASRRWLVAHLSIVAVIITVGSCTRVEPIRTARDDNLVVFAAVCLREAFAEMAKEFETRHPGTTVTFNFAGTQELRTQLEHGASVDVFASADQRHMDALLRGARVASPVVFARNEPVVIIAKESAGAIRSFADVPNATRIVIGAPEVPIGRYTLQILDRASNVLGADYRARIEASIVSRELNVRQVLAKVSLGEAQVGVVYRTDAQTALDRVAILDIPATINVVADHPTAVVTGAAHPSLARDWVDFVLSAEGQRTLRDAGFLGAVDGAAP